MSLNLLIFSSILNPFKLTLLAEDNHDLSYIHSHVQIGTNSVYVVLLECPRQFSHLFRMRLLLSFTPSVPFPSLKLSSTTVNKCPIHRSLSLNACLQSHPTNSLESHLLALSADDAASAARVHLRSSPDVYLSSQTMQTWPVVLQALAAAAIVGFPLSRLINRLGFDSFFTLSPENTYAVLHHLRHCLNMTFAQRRRVVTNSPNILTFDAGAMFDTIRALRETGLTSTHIRSIVLRWPGVLQLSPLRIRRVANYFTRPPIFLSPSLLVSLLRRAPWVLIYDVDNDLAPIINWLSDNIPHSSLDKIVTSNPRVFSAKREELSKVRNFLQSTVGLSSQNTATVIASYPPLLTLSINSVLVPAVHTLLNEVPLAPKELVSCVRAFPAILSLDPESTVRPVVNFFRKYGVVNVARIVIRLPPVLGYDVETNLAPKMDFLLNELGLGIFQVLKFPGLFSHPLEGCIKPRTRFVIFQGKSISKVGLSQIVSLSDTEFSERLIGVPVSKYYAFRNTVIKGEDNHVIAKKYILNAPVLDRKGSRKNSKDDPKFQGERRVWGRKKYRVTLTRIPWTDLP